MLFNLPNIFSLLKIWKSDTERVSGRDRDLSSAGSYPEWLQQSGWGQAKNQELGTLSGSPRQVSGAQALETSSAAFPGTLAES